MTYKRPTRLRRPTSIAPPRDTGLTLKSPRERHAAHREKARLQRVQLSVMAAIVVVALVASILVAQPFGSDSTGDGTGDGPLPEQMAVATTVDADPTPLFANYRSLHLYLPVTPESLTEIAFHQASGDYALSLDSLVPDADMVFAADNRGTGRPDDPACEEATDTPGVLGGNVLRMWRSNRSGPCDTAADIGAQPGTQVLSPVSGQVVEVRPYYLYGEHEDVEIHIQPTGWPELDVVLIHIGEVCIEEGDEVIGGVTPIAKIRLLSDRVTPQLGQYTWDGGDHVHMQLNQLEVPGKLRNVEDGS